MEKHTTSDEHCLLGFKTPVTDHSLPEKFTFPFYYEPHPLCVLAATELQQVMESNGWDADFGTHYEKKGIIGKMFGVLVVQTPENTLGYLAAFSGKLPVEHPVQFVPPVFDLQTEGRFFLEGEQVLNRLNSEVEQLENAPELIACKQLLARETLFFEQQVRACKQQIGLARNERKIRREAAAETLPQEELESLLETLRMESLNEHYFLKDLTRQGKRQLAEIRSQLDTFLDRISLLKEERKRRSGALQRQLFENYAFLNQTGKRKSLLDIFDMQPPSGAGECAAPKLLQYAFKQGLKPIAVAEFWWGRSPGSEIRTHGQFYPACKSKCEPILGHMLAGMALDENPLLIHLAEEKTIATVYEDDYLLVVNKPAEFLSVPGITIEDSVYSRIKARYPNATGPLIVHRLDMSTSGLLVIAKTKEVHQHLQQQFAEHSVNKRYVALLDGIIAPNEGVIDLPLRVDLEDRPRQLVCFEHGKPAQTKWEVAERLNGKTRVFFYPVTGRTHQLRVHAAHQLGLNTPITGDDLYGAKADRLYLHAESLEFTHPISRERVRFRLDAGF